MLDNSITNSGVMTSIRKGATERKTVIVEYRDKKGVITRRETEPYEIKEDAYYGFCLDKNQIRRFTLTNILDAKVTNNSYKPQWPVKI